MAIWWGLAAVWLVTSQAGAGSAPNDPPVRRDVKGYGPTIEVAKQNALREAQQQLVRRLREHDPPLTHWQPSEAFVKEHLLDGSGQPGGEVVVDQVGAAKTWIVTLKLPGDALLTTWDRTAEREERAEARLGMALQAAAALVLALLVVIGYVRVDDWTRSRYTAWLRLASAAVITLVAAGWWWTR